MSGRAAQLAIELAERGASDVAGGLDRVGSAASSMGDKVDSAGRQAEKATSKLDGTAEGADELASKGAQAAGAMGGLGSLIGGPFGMAMQTGGIALQAAADSGDLLNAALENSIVSSIRSKAATVSKTIADKASAVATRGMTIAQKALNLAQRASPIGLIIAGVILLAGALILAYKRSATFRAIVDKAMSVAKAGVEKVMGVFRALGPVVGKVASFIGNVVQHYVQVYVLAFKGSLAVVKATWNGIRDAVSTVVGFIRDKASDLSDKLTDAWHTIRDVGVKAFQALTAPIQAIIDLVDALLDKIKSIHLPHVSLPHFGLRSATSVTPSSTDGSGTSITINLTVQATPGTSTAQAQQTAQDTMDAIDRRLRTIGRRPVFAR